MKYSHKLFFLLLIIMILSSFQLVAKSDDFAYLDESEVPEFELIGREEGLSNLSVSSVIQDKYGFLWIGTQGGLNRYDGENIKVFRHDPFSTDGLIQNLIQTMFYDEEKHEIWIGTYQGISCYSINNNEFKNYTVEDGLSNSVVLSFEKDVNGDIWIGTVNGLDKLDVETETFTNYSVPGNLVRSLYIHNDETMYVGSTEGLLVYSSITDTLVKYDVDLPSPFVMTIDEFSKGKLTLGLWDGGLVILDVQSRETENITFDDNRVYSVEQSPDDTIWVGTWGGGLFSINDGLIKHYSDEDNKSKLSSPVVYSLFVDDAEILWIGTNGGGLNLLNPRKEDFVMLQHDSENPDSLSSGKINSLFVDKKNRMWVSVYNQGINILENNNTITKISKDDQVEFPIPTDSIRVIKEFNNQILLGTDNGIGYYDEELKAYIPWDTFQETYIYDIEIVNDHEVWIGTRQNGLYYYNLDTEAIINYRAENSEDTAISDNLIYDIQLDHMNRLWVGTNHGLNLKEEDNDYFDMFYHDESKRNFLAGNTVNTIFESSENEIWLGLSDGGLSLYNEETSDFTNFTEADGLSDNIVESILECELGNIWVGTHSGITVLNKMNNEIFTLLPEDGIGGYEFSKGKYSSDDNMYFTGAHGITKIPKDFSNSIEYSPKIYITNIDLFKTTIEKNKYIFNDTSYILNPEDNFLKFEFVAVDFDQVNHLSYYYQLEGYDDDYINNGNSTNISYSHLPAGEYVFKVYGKTNKDTITEVAKTTIVIKEYWYKTIYAYALFSLGILLLVYLFFKLRENHIVKKKNEELAIVNDKLENVNETLKDLSLTDGLTGVYNHRYFDKHMEEHLELAKRNHNTYISLLMIDIDDFKGINDKYGHIVGDKLLQKISKEVTAVLPRSTDILARYGGDEFVVVLYDTKIHGALIVAQRIRRTVEECSIPFELVYDEKTDPISATASIGLVSLLPDHDTTEESIMQKADEALYKAKEEGKNRVVIHGEEE